MSNAKYYEKFYLLWYKMYGEEPSPYSSTYAEKLARIRFYKNLKRRKKILTNN